MRRFGFTGLNVCLTLQSRQLSTSDSSTAILYSLTCSDWWETVCFAFSNHAVVHILQPIFLVPATALFLGLVMVLWLQDHLVQNLSLHLGLLMQQRLSLPYHMISLETDRGRIKGQKKQTETDRRRGHQPEYVVIWKETPGFHPRCDQTTTMPCSASLHCFTQKKENTG